MLSLTALRYRTVLASDNGPVARVETGEVPFFGRRLYQSSAWLVAGLAPPRAPTLYGDADGTGSHPVSATSRHIAISAALERWAYHVTVKSPAASAFRFDIDRSSNGLAAHPSRTTAAVRRHARFEAIERFCVFTWWEDRLPGKLLPTEWPGVKAVVIDGPFAAVTVILYQRSEWGHYSYGRAAASSFAAACRKALVKLARHDWVLRTRRLLYGSVAQGPPGADLFERRSLFFSHDEGHELFLRRAIRTVQPPFDVPEMVADAEIKGPWSCHARLWRVVLRPPSSRFLEDDDRYFFW